MLKKDVVNRTKLDDQIGHKRQRDVIDRYQQATHVEELRYQRDELLADVEHLESKLAYDQGVHDELVAKLLDELVVCRLSSDHWRHCYNAMVGRLDAVKKALGL
jgi:hypothetical protein